MIYINDHLTEFDLQTALPLLSEQRRERVLSYRHEGVRRQSAAAYLLLCQGLREQYGIATPPRLAFHEGGKPYLPDYPGIHFNLSHCREAAVCALGHHRMGIDVEAVAHYKEAVARYTMSDAEMDTILASRQPDAVFIRLWTMKEALLKLTGEGLRCDLKTLLDGTRAVFSTHASADGRYIYTLCEDSAEAGHTARRGWSK